jgi:hypothetical protein
MNAIVPLMRQIRGPPESPWQESILPSSIPAQNIPSPIAFVPYTKLALHVSWGNRGIQVALRWRE